MQFEYEILEGSVTLIIEVEDFDESEIIFSAHIKDGEFEGPDVTEEILGYGLEYKISEYFFDNYYAEAESERNEGKLESERELREDR